MTTTFTAAAIEKFVADWYRKLDVHAPMVELLPMLANEDLMMKFPEATLYKHSGFEGWYQRVIRLFFDEVHNVKKTEAVISGATAEVRVVVEWEASVWEAPAAESVRYHLDADQSWLVRAASNDFGVEIVRYTVNGFEYYPNSARL